MTSGGSQALCLICQEDLAKPVICTRCEDQARRDLDRIGAMCHDLAQWHIIDPGTPSRDDHHILSLIDSPLITAHGTPNLDAMAATDPRSTPPAEGADPDDPDNVIPAAHWLIAEAAYTRAQRHLSSPLRDVHDAVRILNMSFDWSIRSPRANDYSRVLELAALGLRHAVRDHGERTIGHCTAKRADRDICGGPLRLAYNGPMPLDPDNQITPTHLECAWCKDPWPLDPATLIAMLRVAAPTSFPIRVSYAAEQLRIPERTIQHWAAVGKIRRHGHGQVDLVDLLAIHTASKGDTDADDTDERP